MRGHGCELARRERGQVCRGQGGQLIGAQQARSEVSRAANWRCGECRVSVSLEGAELGSGQRQHLVGGEGLHLICTRRRSGRWLNAVSGWR